MRQFTVSDLKSTYIRGELESFCEVLMIDVEEFEQMKGYELIFIVEREMKELKEIGIFDSWI